MLVIDHIGQEMNQIGRVFAEYSSADQSRCFRTDPKIITGEVKPPLARRSAAALTNW